ncbi:MAG: class II D-tagatose-bisphosphate aldolase, non-catalytic subunit [Oscillospiraceae bacterium]|nr:class II D-tagatose-bisphosphate aldolase, non-catalytic subunit [Oscillospiraceae bacterium]
MHPIIARFKQRQGVVSYCTANALVLEAVMEDAVAGGGLIVVEATANQVNQFGGYTGMQAHDFTAFIQSLAQKAGLDESKLVLGGDHLGPIIWKGEPEAQAMEKAKELVRTYVAAGFSKIHLDTSMPLADDSKEERLSTETIARRGAVLARAAMEAWEVRRRTYPDAQELVFVIGSEVPVPGGAEEDEEGISVTSPADFAETVSVYRRVFLEAGLEAAWRQVIAVVVQPGVEFSDNVVFQYDHAAARALTQKLEDYPALVFEGHSTDYQTRDNLAAMIQDGIRILKVGPELTFALREALFALTRIEAELLPEAERSNFRDVLDRVMCEAPGYWKPYYHGTETQQAQARMFSLSDRCRYYLGEPAVQRAMERLFENIDAIQIPYSILHQYLPAVTEPILQGERLDARALVRLYLREGVIRKYREALEAGARSVSRK